MPTFCLSQIAKFSELRLKPLSEKFNYDSTTIFYPLVKLDDNHIAEKINDVIRKTILFEGEDEDSLVSLDSALQSQANDVLTNLSYEIAFNKKGILSLEFYLEGVAAYPTFWKEYLNFDLKTGEAISTKDIIKEEKYNEFIKLVTARKVAAMKSYKFEMKKELDAKRITKEDYYFAMNYAKENCNTSSSLEKFKLSKSFLQIFDDCEFPHMWLALGPTIELKFKLSSIRQFIKEDVYKKLTL